MTMVPMAAGGNATFTTSMDTYKASETSRAPAVAAATARTSLANAMPSHPPETMMCAASKSLYTGGDTHRSPPYVAGEQDDQPPAPASRRLPSASTMPRAMLQTKTKSETAERIWNKLNIRTAV